MRRSEPYPPIPRRDKLLSPIFGQSSEGIFAGYFNLHLPDLDEIEGMELESIYGDLLGHLEEGNEDLRVDIGVALDLLGKPDQAIRTLEIAENKEDKDALYVLGRILLEQKQAASEIRPLEEGVLISGSADWIMKQKEEKNLSWTAVVNYLREAIKYDSNNVPAQYFLGKAIEGLIKEESLKSVMDAYTAYLDAGAPIGNREAVQSFIYSQNPEQRRKGLVEKGLEAFKNADYPTSRSSFEEAILLGDKESFYHLGAVFEKTGDFLLAVNAYQQAIDAEVTSLPDLPLRFATTVDRLFRMVHLMQLPKILNFSGEKDPSYHNPYLDQLIANLNPHQAPIVALTYSPNGPYVFVVSVDGVGKLWDVSTGTSLFTVDQCSNKYNCIAYAPDGDHALIILEGGACTLWNIQMRKPVLNIFNPIWDEEVENIIAVDYFPDSRRALTLSDHANACVWDLHEGTIEKSFELPFEYISLPSELLSCFKYFPEGKLLASNGMQIEIWDLYTKMDPQVVGPEFEDIHSMDVYFSDTSTLIAYGGRKEDGDETAIVVVWGEDKEEKLLDFNLDNDSAWVVHFSHDGKFLFIGLENGTLQIWEILEKKKIKVIVVGEGPIISLACSPDAREVVVGSQKSTSPKIYHVESGKLVNTLPFYQPLGETVR